jgi:hypothetical protein
MGQLPNRGALDQNDIMAGDVVVVANQYQKIGEVIIPAGLYKSLGFGSSQSQADAIGRLFVKMMDNSTAPGLEVTGRFRVQVFTPQDRPYILVNEWPTSATSQGQTDRTKQIPNPESTYAAGKDYKFVFEFRPSRACTISKSQSFIQIDTTEQLLG